MHGSIRIRPGGTLPVTAALLLVLSASLVANVLAAPTLTKRGSTQNDIYKCPKLNPRATPATSIHNLRIDDFKVIAALGDSITAAFAAKGQQILILNDILENRGLSYAIGGDRGYVTVANLLSRYTNLTGPSKGDHGPELCYGPLCLPFQYHPSQDVFNAAQSGALVSNIQHELTDYLIPAIKSNPAVNFQNDWKLVTLFIMSNDLCLSCDLTSPISTSFLSVADFTSHLLEVLTTIRAQLPRTMVNVMLGLKVSGVWDATKNNLYCKTIRTLGLAVECTCAFPLGDSSAGIALRKQMDDTLAGYNQAILNLRESFLPGGANYDGRYADSFAMVVDPALPNIDIPKWPSDILSNVDCFHPSARAHAAFASIIWNNLQLPFASKIRNIPVLSSTKSTGSAGNAGWSEYPLSCPTDDSFIPTY